MPTVAQLKAQLAAKGLPTDGVKAVLEARLAAAVPAAAAPAQVDVAQLASLKRQLDQLMAAQQGAGGAAGGNAGGDGPALLDLDELKQTNDLEKLKQLCRERGLKDKGNRMQLRAWLRAWNDKQDADDGDDDVEDELEAGPTKKQATGGQKGDVKVGDLAKRDDKVYRVQALVQGPELIYQEEDRCAEEASGGPQEATRTDRGDARQGKGDDEERRRRLLRLEREQAGLHLRAGRRVQLLARVLPVRQRPTPRL